MEKILPHIQKTSLPYLDRSREMDWIEAHRSEYAGRWVALDGDCLIAHGNDPLTFKEEVRLKGIERPFIVHIQDDATPQMGGWL